MPDPVFEESLTKYILRICHRLDIELLSVSNRKSLLKQLAKLVEKRDRTREAFNDKEDHQCDKP